MQQDDRSDQPGPPSNTPEGTPPPPPQGPPAPGAPPQGFAPQDPSSQGFPSGPYGHLPPPYAPGDQPTPPPHGYPQAPSQGYPQQPGQPAPPQGYAQPPQQGYAQQPAYGQGGQPPVQPPYTGGPGGPGGDGTPPKKGRGMAIGASIAGVLVLILAIVGGILLIGGGGGDDKAITELKAQVQRQIVAKYPVGTDITDEYELSAEIPADANRPLTVESIGDPNVKRTTEGNAKVSIPVVLRQKANVPAIYKKGEKSPLNAIKVAWEMEPYQDKETGVWTLSYTKSRVTGYGVERRPLPSEADLPEAKKVASKLVTAAMRRPVGQSTGAYNAAQPADGYLTKKMTAYQLRTVIKKYSGYEGMSYPPALNSRKDGSFGAFTNSLLIDQNWTCFGTSAVRNSSVTLGGWKMKPLYDDAETQKYEERPVVDLQHLVVEAPLTLKLGLRCANSFGKPPPKSKTIRTKVRVVLARPADSTLSGKWRAEGIKTGKNGPDIYSPFFNSSDYTKLKRY